MQNLSVESEQVRMSRVGEWRLRKLEEFPDDTRNRTAACTLFELARTPVDTVRQDIRDRLEALTEGPTVRDAFNKATREIGFHRHHADLNSFLDSVLRAISKTQPTSIQH